MKSVEVVGRFARVTVAALAVANSLAGQVTESHSQNFALGPGESQFNLTFPKFDPASYPAGTTLTTVSIEISAQFSAGIALSSASGTVGWTLGPAHVVTTAAPGLGTPNTDLTLSGSTVVPSGQEVVLDGGSRPVTQVTYSENAPTVANYILTGGQPATVSYDVDLLGLYTAVQTSPGSAVGVFWSDQVTGTLNVKYTATTPSPTDAVLLAFGAASTGPTAVSVNWKTGVESNLIGFLLDRQVGGEGWNRISPTIIPATGQGGPASYHFEDKLPAPGSAEVRYRLSQVDREGQASDLGQTIVVRAPQVSVERSNAMLQISVNGEPNGRVRIETSTDLAGSLWLPVASLRLDGSGVGKAPLAVSYDEATRFYRVIVE